MRIGTIAQHSNLTPINVKSTLKNIDSRINNHPIWVWYDFTDPFNGMGDADPNITNNLQTWDDKGRFDADLSTDGESKGPTWIPGDGASAFDNPNQQSLVFAGRSFIDYMKFTNPADLSCRNFTAIAIFDLHSDQEVSRQEIIFDLKGNTSAGNLRRMKFTVQPGDTAMFGDYFSFDITKNDGEVTGIASTISGSTGQKGFTDNDGNFNSFAPKVAGDSNYKFNYVYIVGRSDGSAEYYIRGKSISNFSAGSWPDEVIPASAVSKIFGTSQTNTDDINANFSPGTAFYELLIYNKALSDQELYHIDWYIANKYHYRTKGRHSGY
jgi:hypothetical protein